MYCALNKIRNSVRLFNQSNKFYQQLKTSCRQVRIKGGVTGAIAPAPPLLGGSPWWNLFVSNKIFVWKILWFRSDTRIQL